MRAPRLAALESALPRYEFKLNLPPLEPKVLFDFKVDAVWLEIGFGGGEHLAEQARRHPEIGFIGCEPYRNGLSSLLQIVESERLQNIRVFTEDARFLLKALAPATITRCFVLFADPWPKKRHARRRIINSETLIDLSRILTSDGELHLATDSPDLKTWYEDIVAAHDDFEWDCVTQAGAEARPVTRYEQKALQAGRRPSYYKAVRKH